jgi:tetrahydromethanopterin S-methyltransferase subunit G
MLKFGFTILIASLPILYKMEIDKRELNERLDIIEKKIDSLCSKGVWF